MAANEEIVVQLRAEIQGFKTQLQQASDAIAKFTKDSSDSLKKPTNPMNELKGSIMDLAAGYISLQAAVQLVGRAFSQSIKLDSVKSALTAVLGSTELADAQLQQIAQTADSLGLNFLDLADSYKNFAASALSSNQTLGDTDKIFNSVVKAASVLKLSSEDVKGTLNALSQMFSKGQVSAEELRQQLGERLPGAVALMAKGLGVTTKELNKMLEQGQITTAAVVKLADQLNIAYGDKLTGRVDSLQASVQRLNNTFTKGVDTGGLGKFFKFWIDGVNQIIETLEHAYIAVTNFGKSFAAIEFESKLNKYLDLVKKINSTPLSPQTDQKVLIQEQGAIVAAMDENIHLLNLARDAYGENSKVVTNLNKQYDSLSVTLKKVNSLIKPNDGIVNVNDLNTFKGLNDEIKKVKTELDLIPKGQQLISKQTELDKLVKRLQELKFYAEGINPNSLVSINAQINALNDEASKLPLSSSRLSDINEELVKLGNKKNALEDALRPPPTGELERYQREIERIQKLQAASWDITEITAYANMLKRLQAEYEALTAVTYTNAEAFKAIWQDAFAGFVQGTQGAFEQALWSGKNFTQNFKEAFLQMIKAMIAKLAAALVMALLLSVVLGGLGLGSIGAGAKILGMSGVTNFGTLLGSTLGSNIGGKVAMPLGSVSNSGQVAFEIQGDKLVGVLQNYNGRLNRLV